MISTHGGTKCPFSAFLQILCFLQALPMFWRMERCCVTKSHVQCYLEKLCTTYMLHSMTSLLAHIVAQRTKWRFLPKNLNQLVIFVIELAFTWSRIDKNRAQFQKTNYFKKMKLSQNGFIISFCTNLIIKTETKIKIYKTDKTDFWHKNWLWISNFGDFC